MQSFFLKKLATWGVSLLVPLAGQDGYPKVRVGYAAVDRDEGYRRFIMWTTNKDDPIYTDGMFALRRMDFYPKGFDLDKLNKGAIVRVVINDIKHNDEFHVLDNLEVEWRAYAATEWGLRLLKGNPKMLLSKREQALLNGLNNPFYTTRRVCIDRIVADRSVKLACVAMHSNYEQVRSTGQLIWQTLLRKELPNAEFELQ